LPPTGPAGCNASTADFQAAAEHVADALSWVAKTSTRSVGLDADLVLPKLPRHWMKRAPATGILVVARQQHAARVYIRQNLRPVKQLPERLLYLRARQDRVRYFGCLVIAIACEKNVRGVITIAASDVLGREQFWASDGTLYEAMRRGPQHHSLR